jgi:hypothetical protein
LDFDHDCVSSKLCFVRGVDLIAIVIIVVCEGEQRFVQLLKLLMRIKVGIFGIFRQAQLMQRKNMEAGNTLKAIHGDLDIFRLGYLLNGKIVSDRSRSIPNELVNFP